MQKNNTSWGGVAPWYNKIVGVAGHYYHEKVIFPNLKKLYTPKSNDNILDLGCGQGVYARLLPSSVSYTGIDLSKELIAQAKKLDNNRAHQYYVADATQPLPVPANTFDVAISILALQNIKNSSLAIANMAGAVRPGGKLIMVLNHPAYRIPRQSSWEVDEKNQLEYRRVNRYMSPLEIPINAHPGIKNSQVTWTYHNPISYFTKALADSGCVITNIEEWVSDKESQGKAKKMENRARAEFPLFLTITASKI